MRGRCESRSIAILFFCVYVLNRIFTVKTYEFKCIALKLTAFMWVDGLPELSVLCILVWVRTLCGSEMPALWKTCSAKQLWKKSMETRPQAPALSQITWNNPRASCGTNTPALASSGAGGLAVQKPLLARRATFLCCLVVKEKGTVCSIFLIRAVD